MSINGKLSPFNAKKLLCHLHRGAYIEIFSAMPKFFDSKHAFKVEDTAMEEEKSLKVWLIFFNTISFIRNDKESYTIETGSQIEAPVQWHSIDSNL